MLGDFINFISCGIFMIVSIILIVQAMICKLSIIAFIFSILFAVASLGFAIFFILRWLTGEIKEEVLEKPTIKLE